MADQLNKATGSFSVINPDMWSANFYDELLASLPMAAVIDSSYSGEISTLGSTVKISTFPEYDEAQVLTEGARNDAEATTPTQQDLVINKNIVKDFIITNQAQLQSLPHMEKLNELASYAINKKIQSLILSLSIPSASAPDHQIPYDSGSTLVLLDLLEGKELLDTQNVPQSDRHLVMDAAQLNDLYNVSGFTSSDFITSGAPLETGQLPPAILGMMPHFTTEVSAVTHMFHSTYFTMAAQQGISVSQYDLGVDGIRAARINTSWLGGFKQLDDKRTVQIS